MGGGAIAIAYGRWVGFGLGCGTSRSLRLGLLLAGAATAVSLALAQGATGDTAPIPSSPDLPWTDPAHHSPLELLAGQIASHIAGHPVSVQCEGDTDWASIVSGMGGDPNAESGFVASQWNSSTGQLVSLSNVAVLASNICLPLNDFAMATTKPTKCVAVSADGRSLVVDRRSKAPKRTVNAKAKAVVAVPGPCYLGGGETAATMTPAFWTNYSIYSIAILTLAHESIHLSGIVGGQLANGLEVGDPQAEAKADCYGMQWMPYIAEQLGDTPDDAQAIATYFWDKIYPLSQATHPEYWSPDCRPGGALDTRPPGATAWP